MRIRKLRLSGVDQPYEVDFTDASNYTRALSVVAGAFSTGKSSVLEFIDYCLGAKNHPPHPEVRRKVRSASLEVTLSGEPHVIERSVGEQPSAHAFVRAGRLGDIDIPPVDRRSMRPPGDPRSLSSLLLSHCGLEGVELREAPTQADSATDPLSFRDLMSLCFLPNERLDDKNLLFENTHMKRLKLGQVVDVVFGVHDDKAVELGRRIGELEKRLSRARTDYTAAEEFLFENKFGNRIDIESELDRARASARSLDTDLRDLDSQILDVSTFAERLRIRHRSASERAQRAAMVLRDRETQVRRLVPLRAQYADDVSKLIMLAEAHELFDPLRVQVCPACMNPVDGAVSIDGGHCSLCHSVMPSQTTDAEVDRDSQTAQDFLQQQTPTAHAHSPAANPFDVSTELRATKARLREITAYIDDLEREIGARQEDHEQAKEQERQLATQLDQSTRHTVTPFLSQRDDLMRRKQESFAAVERTQTAIRMLDSLDRRGTAVTRLQTQIDALHRELDESSTEPDRDRLVSRISDRYREILTSWRYPKIDHAFIDTKLVPHMRGTSYRDASSGGRTLISMAWALAIFEIAWESGASHPGFMMIDSPQKNLGQGKDRDVEFADSIAVDGVYKHLNAWLDGPGAGAQILIVDNAPPAMAGDDVVIRFSGRADVPPYGLISDEVS
ncbi:DNA recombination protein RecN [Rhodococcus sp. SC4]|nr:DNA recombination protein RecN [Rhodococcus sp. SC4]